MLLSVNDLHVYYGAIHAVKGVSLEVNEGEIVTLIGANGAGKSTVLNTISGLLRAKTGTIEFMGTPINNMAPNKIVQLGLAQCPEGRRVFAHMTVEENLEMGAYTRPNSTIEGNMAHVYDLFPRLKERRRQIAARFPAANRQSFCWRCCSRGRAGICSSTSRRIIWTRRAARSSAGIWRKSPVFCSSRMTARF